MSALALAQELTFGYLSPNERSWCKRMNETLTIHDTEPTLATRMNGTLAIHEMEKAKDNAKGMGAPRKNWWLALLGILLVAAIVACWPVFHPLAKALTCGLGPTLAVGRFTGWRDRARNSTMP